MGGRVGGRERDKVYRPTNDTDFAPTKISRSGGIRYHERSSYAPLFFFSVCGALVSRGFKRKTLRLFDARFPLPFFPVPGLITRVRQKYTRRRRKGFGGEFSARSSRFDVYLGSRNIPQIPPCICVIIPFSPFSAKFLNHGFTIYILREIFLYDDIIKSRCPV